MGYQKGASNPGNHRFQEKGQNLIGKGSRRPRVKTGGRARVMNRKHREKEVLRIGTAQTEKKSRGLRAGKTTQETRVTNQPREPTRTQKATSLYREWTTHPRVKKAPN